MFLDEQGIGYIKTKKLESDSHKGREIEEGIDEPAALGRVTVMVGIALESHEELLVVVHGS